MRTKAIVTPIKDLIKMDIIKKVFYLYIQLYNV